MQIVTALSNVPNVPAVYAMYGGRDARQYVAYAGIADKLRQRLTQHLVRRDSSVTTGTSAVTLNPDLVTAVHWWEHDLFADRDALAAAELVAMDLLDPTIRSRGPVPQRARDLHSDPCFQQKMEVLFHGTATGVLRLFSLHDAFQRITEIEARLTKLENQFIENDY
jgi:hypothetical protein